MCVCVQRYFWRLTATAQTTIAYSATHLLQQHTCCSNTLVAATHSLQQYPEVHTTKPEGLLLNSIFTHTLLQVSFHIFTSLSIYKPYHSTRRVAMTPYTPAYFKSITAPRLYICPFHSSLFMCLRPFSCSYSRTMPARTKVSRTLYITANFPNPSLCCIQAIDFFKNRFFSKIDFFSHVQSFVHIFATQSSSSF